jgi:serine/threonine-protein kinase
MSEVSVRLSAALSDRYAIEREVGAGGMATVYLARDLRHNRRVAVKVLRPELAAVLGRERFLAEIETTANLQHPNLLALFDSGEADGLLFYVMPFVDGESLRARLERERQLPVDDAVKISTAVASALDHAHRHGVIHRDLKPENILLHEGQPLVADFGIALAVSIAGGSRVTQTGLSLGTPAYMSPEQATGDRNVDARSDQYSLAAVTYEMLVGEAPHAAPTAQGIIAKLLTERPRSVRAARTTVPPHVDLALQKALEKLPADRFHSAQQFADALLNPQAVPTRIGVGAGSGLDAPAAWRSRAAAGIPWVLAIASVVVAGFTIARAESAPATPITRVQVDPGPGVSIVRNEAMVAVSPGGERIAFVARDGGVRRVYVRDLSEL